MVFDPVEPVRAWVIEVNSEAALVLRHHGRSDILVIDTAPDGSIRELRQLSNPDKLTRVSL